MKSLKKDRIYQQLLSDIDSGKLKKGSKLPTERELSKQLGVSIVTLRSALERLEKSGKIERIRSQGTFISKGTTQIKNTRGRIGCLLRPYENNSKNEAYFNDITANIYSEIMKRSYQLIQPPVCLAMRSRKLNSDTVKNIISTIESLQNFVDGFILDERIPDEVISHFEKRQCKAMVIVNRQTALSVDSVVPDLTIGAKKIVDISLKLNYERFVVCKVERSTNSLTCFDKILEELQKHGVSKKNISILDGLSENYLAEFLEKFNNELKDAVNKKTVFFAGHESLAKFICERLSKKGLIAGRDIGIAGCFLTDKNQASHITTINFSPQELAESSVEALFERINNNIYNLSRKIELPVNLFIGETL